MLAGLVKAPSAFNPVASMPKARDRQLYVLNRMVADSRITTQQASDAYGARPPRIVKKTAPQVPTIAPEFRDYVRSRLNATFNEDQLFEGGLRVRTTLNLDLQKAVVQAVHSVLHSRSDPEAAVIAIDPRNGDIRAMTTRFVKKHVSGYRTDGTNLVTDAERSTGSTIKPFTLAAALESGLTLNTVRYGPPCVSIPNPGGTPNPYRPCNAGDGEAGTFTLRAALANSVNTIYAPLAADIGLHKVMKVAGAAGLAPKANLRTNLANALGVEITPISEAVAYSTLIHHGVRHDPRSILQVREGGSGAPDSGTVVYSAKQAHGVQVIPRHVAGDVRLALADVVNYGTGVAAQQPFQVYGKTGTTNDETNAWFTGCTPTLCIATWMGYDKQFDKNGAPNSMHNVEGVSAVFGGTLPAQIFATAWDDYRSILAAKGRPAATPSPTPRAPIVVHPVAPSTSPKPRHRPKPTRTPGHSTAPTVPPTRPPTARPTPVPTRPSPLPSLIKQ
jgi:penicillin-binding protein 1A